MFKIPGYEIDEQIHAGRNSLVFKARSVADGSRQPVVIKVLAKEYPTAREIARFFNEFEIARSLDLPGVVQVVGMEKVGHGHALVLEDFEARPLSEQLHLFENRPIPALELCLSLVDTLDHIHSRGIVHKDIKPENVLLNHDRGQVKLTDFGIASLISREDPSLKNPDALEGTLEYISPEQTGRINRAVDYRSDFYSLGVFLYRLLTGRLPFRAQDPLELVHAHIARVPESPAAAGVPGPLAGVVMKLLAKTPEERYQSASGIRDDLRRCLEELKSGGRIAPFEPGATDFSEHLRIPQKLYGREGEVQALLDAFDDVTGKATTRLMLVGGYSGIGKSALVKEIHRPLLEKRGYFISGKYDQFRRDVPCMAIIQAFQELVRQLLTESEQSIAEWREALVGALGPNGQVICEAIPEIELIIGPQPAVEDLSPIESRNRFNATFRFMVRAIAGRDRPVTIFLDDLQWADLTSFELLQLILTDRSLGNLFVIGAFRDNEVDEAHPLNELRQTLEKAALSVDTIYLAPLGTEHVTELLCEALRLPPERTRSLAELIHAKTGGNPYFISEFLRSLRDEGYVRFDQELRAWSWSLDRIQAMQSAENVVDLMTGKIRKLPAAALRLVQTCACIGSRFNLDTLALVSGQTPEATAADLDLPLREGFLIPLDETYKYAGYSERIGRAGGLNAAYKFAHDRVQQAAYSLLSDDERRRIHLTIGRQLLSGSGADLGGEDQSIEIAGHLNHAHDLMEDPSERLAASAINLRAGVRAKGSTAYQVALQMLESGLRLLPEDPWQDYYQLTLDLHNHLMEAAYLVGDFDLFDEMERAIRSGARDVLDTVKAREARIVYHTGRENGLDAVHTALEALRDLGVSLPRRATLPAVLKKLGEVRLTRGLVSIEALADLPVCTDPRVKAIMRILLIAIPPAYIASPNHLPLFALTGVRLSIRHGNSPESSYCYGIYGMVQSGKLWDFETGFRLGQVAMRVAERPENRGVLQKTTPAHYYFLYHYNRFMREGMPQLQDAIRLSIEVGDYEYVGWNSFFYSTVALLSGTPLPEAEKIFRRYIEMNLSYRQEPGANFLRAMGQFTLNMQGRAEDSGVLSGELYEDDVLLPELVQSKHYSAAFCSFLMRMMMYYHYGDIVRAGAARDEGEGYLDSVLSMPVATAFYFYAALIDLTRHASSGGGKKPPAAVRVNRNRLRKLAASSTENYGHKFDIVEAEIERLRGRDERAYLLYDRAIKAAREHGYVQEEAIACVLAAKAYRDAGREQVARAYMQEAHYCYRLWGADEMLGRLEREYPTLLRRSESATTTTGTGRNSSTGDDTTRSQDLDLQTALKTSQAISSEIKLDRLIERFMRILVESAGATRGFFIMETDGRLAIRARIEGESPVRSEVTPVRDSPEVFANLIYYVDRTHEPVVINDFAAQNRFAGDPYLKTHKPQSALCASVMSQGNQAGIIYLENELVPGAFNERRLRLLTMLSAQVAVSIQNAFLYATMEERVVERTAELNNKTRELQRTLNMIQELKRKQDADFFLTSRLMQPFGIDKSAGTGRVECDIFVRQKKKFQYKKWRGSIGGDISGAHSIELRGRACTVFFNADAMGKSIQGSSGALVLGTVFEAMIQRTRVSKTDRALHPEAWLQMAVEELHKVFENFDGAMMMTMILGVVDDERGTLYLVNADHPLPVLFREGRARYLRFEEFLPKIGFLLGKSRFFVRVMRLEPGDAIICGSDGRDDLAIGFDEDGNRRISDDPRVFLAALETAGGNLKRAAVLLARHGRLIDDLSLIRVTYRGPVEIGEEGVRTRYNQALDLHRAGKNREALDLLDGQIPFVPSESAPPFRRLRVPVLYNLKEFASCYEAALDYLEYDPGDGTVLLCLARSGAMIGRANGAREALERLLLRRPEDEGLQALRERLDARD